MRGVLGEKTLRNKIDDSERDGGGAVINTFKSTQYLPRESAITEGQAQGNRKKGDQGKKKLRKHPLPKERRGGRVT